MIYRSSWPAHLGSLPSETKAIHRPSGEYMGLLSAPFHATRTFTSPLSEGTVEISCVVQTSAVGLTWCEKAIVFPSGDQSNDVTWKFPDVNRLVFRSPLSGFSSVTVLRCAYLKLASTTC